MTFGELFLGMEAANVIYISGSGNDVRSSRLRAVSRLVWIMDTSNAGYFSDELKSYRIEKLEDGELR